MKRLILIHGINNENNTADRILDDWIDSIRAKAGKDSAWAERVRSVAEAPFYGKALAAHSSSKKGEAVAQGVEDAPDDFAEFAEEAFYEMALQMGASKEALDAEAGESVVEKGAGAHKTWVKAIARVVERVSPLKGELALRILKQAHVYLKRPNAARAVDDIVRKAMESDEPAIIVSHSLGTIVSYKLLREFAGKGAPRPCPLYVTLGSPLGIDVVRKSFSLPRNRPADVARWVNGADPEDFVALRKKLTIDNFGPGVDLNISDIRNGNKDPHSITDYLSDSRIADEIAAHFS